MRLIDADALFERAFEIWGIEADGGETNLFMKTINDATTISPVKHGRIVWKERYTGGFEYKDVKCHNCGAKESIEIRRPVHEEVAYCSECGKRLCSRSMEYCPACGAKMDLDNP